MTVRITVVTGCYDIGFGVFPSIGSRHKMFSGGTKESGSPCRKAMFLGKAVAVPQPHRLLAIIAATGLRLGLNLSNFLKSGHEFSLRR